MPILSQEILNFTLDGIFSPKEKQIAKHGSQASYYFYPGRNCVLWKTPVAHCFTFSFLQFGDPFSFHSRKDVEQPLKID